MSLQNTKNAVNFRQLVVDLRKKKHFWINLIGLYEK
jgi:hypothetical protein